MGKPSLPHVKTNWNASTEDINYEVTSTLLWSTIISVWMKVTSHITHTNSQKHTHSHTQSNIWYAANIVMFTIIHPALLCAQITCNSELFHGNRPLHTYVRTLDPQLPVHPWKNLIRTCKILEPVFCRAYLPHWSKCCLLYKVQPFIIQRLSVNLSDSLLSIEVTMHHASYGSSLVTVVGVTRCIMKSWNQWASTFNELKCTILAAFKLVVSWICMHE